MAGKVVITGSNRGIGLEFVRQWKARGSDVIAVCRQPSPPLKELGVHIEAGVDVASDSSVHELGTRLSGQGLDVLVLNAGVLRHEALGSLDFQSIEQQFQVNAVGPLRVAEALLSNLHEGSKIAIITSRMGSIADNTSGGHYGYRMSKAAVNMAGVSLANDLKPHGIAVAILHPGFVRTEMTGGKGQIDPAESVRGMLQRIDDLSLSNTGTFWHANGEVLPW